MYTYTHTDICVSVCLKYKKHFLTGYLYSKCPSNDSYAISISVTREWQQRSTTNEVTSDVAEVLYKFELCRPGRCNTQESDT